MRFLLRSPGYLARLSLPHHARSRNICSSVPYGAGLDESRCRTNLTWREPEGVDSGVTVYNTLTKCRTKLILPRNRVLRWYVCGPTVYDEAHIGHASSYVRLDIVRRVLTSLFNTDVVLMMGITDIDDKIINKAKELHTDANTVARQYESKFFSSMAKLNVCQPTITARVSSNVPHIVAFVSKIIEKGHAYATAAGNVYFNVPLWQAYGKLNPPTSAEQVHDAALPAKASTTGDKKDARDFALWKSAKPGEPSWESPWGQGRPGWHIECSALASQIFGSQLDIHSGGVDLVFPHHENELAQSEAYHSCGQWVNYWLHTGLLHSGNDTNKMSKSLKNFVTVDQMLERYSASQFRLFCLLSPYRNRIEYSDDTMKAAVRMHKQILTFLSTADSYVNGHWTCSPINEVMLASSLQAAREQVTEALADDFNTARAVQALMALVHVANIELNRCGPGSSGSSQAGPRSPGLIAGVMSYVNKLMDIFGIGFASKQASASDSIGSESQVRIASILNATLSFRDSVRSFALAKEEPVSTGTDKESRKVKLRERQILLAACDSLRDALASSCGVQIKDRGDRSTWELSTEDPTARKAVKAS